MKEVYVVILGVLVIILLYLYFRGCNCFSKTPKHHHHPPHPPPSRPKIIAGPGAGSSAYVEIKGTDSAGIITLVTGMSPQGNETIFAVDFGTPLSTQPSVILTPANPKATADINSVYVFLTDIQGFEVVSSPIPITGAYRWYYIVSPT